MQILTGPLLQRLFFEYRNLILWIVIAIVGFVFFTVIYNQAAPAPSAESGDECVLLRLSIN
ncbi:MAG: hypothetical protein KatS3mg087_0869 [Patescibacteria group bacterium]|nr:MAG: hypothetical protein KatS3mg087_0869 [Patescibacteria group bacterium]